MKIALKYLLFLICFFTTTNYTAQDIPQSEKDALQAIYTEANGDAWTNTTQNQGKWDFSTPVTSWNNTTQTGWWGVTVTNGHITALNFTNNNLTGSLSENIGDLTSLTSLTIEKNKLAGAIPKNIGKLSNLITLAISSNLFTSFPDELANLKKLGVLFMYSNPFNSDFPPVIFELSSLKRFIGNHCGFKNALPDLFHKIPELFQFSVQYNQLSGSLPNSLATSTKLTGVDVTGNKFEGKFPSLVNSKSLNYLGINRNKFRFIDFVDEFQHYKSSFTNFFFENQAKTDSRKTIVRHAGQTVTMEMFEDLRFHSSDTYQWYKNGVAIVGQTNRILTLSNVTTASAGTYMCRASHTSNPDMSPLVLERESITLTVDNVSYTCTNFSSSFTTTGVDGQPYRCGTIKVLPQLSNTDKITEIKWTLTSPDGQTSFLSNQIIPNIEIAQYGKYRIDARIVDSNGCEKTIDHFSFDVFDCTVCDTNIFGEIVFTESNTYTCGRRDFTLSFSNPDNMSLTYEWKFYKADGSLWYTEENLAAPKAYFNFYGTNKVELVIKNDQYKCQTRTLSINIPVLECKNTCPIPGEIQISNCIFSRSTSDCNYTCGDRTAYFALNSEQEIYENSTYSWIFKNPSGQVIGTSNSTNHQVPFTFTTIGNNTAQLTITNADGCPTVFTPLVVPVVSCCTPVVGEIKVYNNAHLRTTQIKN